jgi:N6-L-threonylcarbamoyladenine synthase
MTTHDVTRTILAIESSCDETAAAVLRGREVLGECVATQAELHERFGGVVPEIASRRHLELVDVVIRDALRSAGLTRVEDVDAVAVTNGPGLVGALLVGVAAGTARAWAAQRPLIAVDHLLGHVASALLDPDVDAELPFLCLLVSGGHTLVLDVDEQLHVTLLGTTRDDAAGEAFDKGARMLGLPMPGGPSLSALAASGDDAAVPFTPAMVHHRDTLDTSFSGLKTALSVALQQRAAGSSDATDADLAAGYERAIVETIAGCARKLLRERGPASGHPHARRSLALVGGVAANSRLRQELSALCDEFDVECVRTPLRWCGDNAVMIALAAGWCTERTGSAAWTVDVYAASPLFRDGTLVPS